MADVGSSSLHSSSASIIMSWDTGSVEWTNNKLLHLRAEGLLSNIRTCHQDLKYFLSEGWILVGKLKGKCWEDCMEITPVLKGS